jgi:DNA-binding LytR/AlgR family response regulator
VRLNLDEILYAEGVRDYIRFYLRNGETLLSQMQIKKLEEILPPPEFIRVHRSFMVHLPDVIVFEHNRVMVGDVSIPVSERYKSRIQDYLEQHTLN